jgi:hypothetical protein
MSPWVSRGDHGSRKWPEKQLSLTYVLRMRGEDAGCTAQEQRSKCHLGATRVLAPARSSMGLQPSPSLPPRSFPELFP